MRFSPRLILAAVSAVTLSASVARAQGAAIAIGAKAPELAFTDDAAKRTVVDPSAKTATVLIYVSSRCPVSVAYNARMKGLYDDYASKPVQFAFVSANVNETAAELAKLRTDAGFPFPVYQDIDNAVADKLGAQVTPEVYIFGKDGTLQYHGAIDDSRDEAKVGAHSAKAALDAVLVGKKVDVASTKAFGCTIKRKPSA